MEEPRSILKRIREFCLADAALASRYEEAKLVVKVFSRSAFYEITQRCNLKCEGCYYFTDDFRAVEETKSIAAWEKLFEMEACRKVTMAYFVGAEPALEQERLFAAAQHFPHGNVGTNGVKRIDPAVPFRIAISVWGGDDQTDRTMRGASAFKKAFKNYAGDRRAIVHYTLSQWNLDSARNIAEMCEDNGLPLTFNMYSAPSSLLTKLAAGLPNDSDFFRVSRPGHTPCFSDEGLAQARRVVEGIMEAFPETVIYSRDYNTWITGVGPRYAIDPSNNIAKGCGSRITGNMRYYGSDLQPLYPKCCTPSIDCTSCRMLSGGWSSKLQPSGHDVVDATAFSRWLDLVGVLNKFFVYRNPGVASSVHLKDDADGTFDPAVHPQPSGGALQNCCAVSALA